MTCCGRRRSQVATNGVAAKPPNQRPASSAVVYEYEGNTGMTVEGPITGRTYRFGQPGARIQIDSRDAPSVAGLPHLRRVA